MIIAIITGYFSLSLLHDDMDRKIHSAIYSIIKDDWKYLEVSDKDIKEFRSTCVIKHIDLNYDGVKEVILESKALTGNSNSIVFYIYKDGPDLDNIGQITGSSLSIRSKIDDIEKGKFSMSLNEYVKDHSYFVLEHYSMIDGRYTKDPNYADIKSEPAK